MDILSLGSDTTGAAHQFEFSLVSPLPGLSATGALGQGPVIFTHIPRTGGVTFDAIFLGAAAVLDRPWMRLAGDSYAQYWGEDKADIAQSIHENTAKLSAAHYISGHAPYGIQVPFRDPPSYITLLRDPLARTWSQLRRIARSSGEFDDSRAIEILEAGQVTDNCQVRMVAGCWNSQDVCDDAMYARAIENLSNHYDLFGLTDEMHRFLSVLATGLGWPSLFFRQRNKSLHLADSPSRAVAEIIQEHNLFDARLLDFVRTHAAEKESEFHSRYTRTDEKSANSDVLYSTDPVTIFGRSVGLLREDQFKSLANGLEWYETRVHEYPERKVGRVHV